MENSMALRTGVSIVGIRCVNHRKAHDAGQSCRRMLSLLVTQRSDGKELCPGVRIARRAALVVPGTSAFASGSVGPPSVAATTAHTRNWCRMSLQPSRNLALHV